MTACFIRAMWLTSRDVEYVKKSRYKETNMGIVVTEKQKQVPTKIFRYFPLVPRLQRMYMSSKLVADMVWHSTDINSGSIFRHLWTQRRGQTLI